MNFVGICFLVFGIFLILIVFHDLELITNYKNNLSVSELVNLDRFSFCSYRIHEWFGVQKGNYLSTWVFFLGFLSHIFNILLITSIAEI